jgi:hypothetical protein
MMERYSAKEISSEDAGAIPAMLKIYGWAIRLVTELVLKTSEP